MKLFLEKKYIFRNKQKHFYQWIIYHISFVCCLACKYGRVELGRASTQWVEGKNEKEGRECKYDPSGSRHHNGGE